jgi:hypothetical protein
MVPNRPIRDACIGCAVAAALFMGVQLMLAPADACDAIAAQWPQLNAWSSQPLLRPFALLLQAC